MLKRCCRSAEEEGEKLLPSGDPEEYAEDWEAGDSEDFEFDVGGGRANTSGRSISEDYGEKNTGDLLVA